MKFVTNYKTVGLLDVCKRPLSFIIFLFIIGISSCDFQADLEQEDYGENLKLNTRSSNSINIVVDSINIKMQMTIDEDSIFIKSLSNNIYKVEGVSGIDKIEYVEAPIRHLLVIDSSRNTEIIYLDSEDGVESERPCCSRKEFKAWYKFIEDYTGDNPEMQVACGFLPCELAYYAVALYYCCDTGTGPPNVPILNENGLLVDFAVLYF
ncbi:MAG: hypothetical protein IPM42_11460 [Saprospiraceae bacterium]|nr:hypothetical protein [Saprospiraceae bacterium]